MKTYDMPLAVKISSTILNDDLWFILDPSYEPQDNLARYYADEIPVLKTKTAEELKQIHETKKVFLGSKVRS